VFRKKINGQAIYRTLDSRAEKERADRIPPEVIKEAETLYGMILTGQQEEFEATKKRKAKVATMGEIFDAWEKWPLVKLLQRKTARGYVNNLCKIIADIHLPKYSNVTGSRRTGNGLSLVDRRDNMVRKMSSSILTCDLIDKWISHRLGRGAFYRAHEVQPEKENDDLTKKEMRRVLISIRTTVVSARSMFAKDARVTGDLMNKKTGAYRDLNLPDTLDEFLGTKTPKPGKGAYKAPTKMEILELVHGLPDLFKDKPEAYKAFKIAYGTGMRIGEIRKLKWADIGDEDDNYLVTLEETKNGHERTNEYLGESLFMELWKMKSDPVYVIGGGREYRAHQLAKDVAAYFRSKNWTRNQCAHELRKYFGCMLARETGDLIEVMHALGHRDYQTTRDYYHDKIKKSDPVDFTSGLPSPGLAAVA
tara:strand:- start:5981 stop:7240 length:1260 start_codon:yes stop_codon:yes gene_type:complete